MGDYLVTDSDMIAGTKTPKGFHIHATKEDAGMRLDVLIQKKNIFPSREQIIKYVEEGRITTDGNIVKPSKRIKDGELIEGEIPEPENNETLIPEKGELVILYEDSDVLVLNKPEGITVHPGAGQKKGTLANFLLHHTKNLSQKHTLRPGIVHRLDKDTSGVLVVAKNDFAHVELQKQFKERTIKKVYLAWIHGAITPAEGKIETYITRHPRDRKKMTAVKKTSLHAAASPASKSHLREAVTHYKTLQEKKNFSLLEIQPLTGRTHQIRVHMAFLKHPVAGDVIYGKDKPRAKRLYLHALRISFLHPKIRERLTFEAPVPSSFFPRAMV